MQEQLNIRNKLNRVSIKGKKYPSGNFAGLTKCFMGNKEIKTKNITVTLCDDGILRITFVENAEIHLDESKEIVEKMNHDTQKWLIFADISGIKYKSKESRDYFASEVVTRHIKAIAFFVNSSLSTFLGNLYTIISKPDVPTRLFTSEQKAIEWLKKFID